MMDENQRFDWIKSIHGYRLVTQPTFQRRINVVSTLWINAEITLMRGLK